MFIADCRKWRANGMVKILELPTKRGGIEIEMIEREWVEVDGKCGYLLRDRNRDFMAVWANWMSVFYKFC